MVIIYLESQHLGGGGKKKFKVILKYWIAWGKPGLQETLSQEKNRREGERKKGREGEAGREEGRNERNNPAYIAETLNPAFPDS